jgi:hypothetical protein
MNENDVPGYKPINTKSTYRGWPIYWNGHAWLYSDNDGVMPDCGGENRPCKKCGQVCNGQQPDPCLGTLPGVKGACCGHGDKENAYILFENGVLINGFDKILN